MRGQRVPNRLRAFVRGGGGLIMVGGYLTSRGTDWRGHRWRPRCRWTASPMTPGCKCPKGPCRRLSPRRISGSTVTRQMMRLRILDDNCSNATTTTRITRMIAAA